MNKKIKKIVVGIVASAMCAVGSVGAISVNAANASDANFSISISGTNPTPNTYAKRLKVDSSSSYVNYTTLADHTTSATGPYAFKCYIYGADNSTDPLVDMSSYTASGTARPEAVVRKGTKGYIYQRVNEFFGSGAYAQVYGSKYSTYTGTAKGCWSPDSSGTGTVYNG